MTKEYKAYHVVIKGRVQHVGFRFWTECKAIKLCLKGFVRNGTDRSIVELEVEGPSDRVEAFLYSVLNEHPYAKIESSEKEAVEVRGYKDFHIIR